MSVFHWLSYFIAAFVPFKDDKLESDMLKDVAHADVAKNEDIVDDSDTNYEDDYYDVRNVKYLQNSLDSIYSSQDDQDDFSEEEEELPQEGETKPVKTDKKPAEDEDLIDDEYTDNEAEGKV